MNEDFLGDDSTFNKLTKQSQLNTSNKLINQSNTMLNYYRSSFKGVER